MAKNLQAFELYQEYLELKQEITELSMKKESPHWYNLEDDESKQDVLDLYDEKVKRATEVVDLMKIYGIKLEDLVLLGMGVDIDLFEK